MTRARQVEDLDADGDVDADDYAVLEGCLGGSDVAPGAGCGAADLDGDGDVDLADYGRLQPQVMGAGAGSGSGSSSPHIVYDFRNLMVRYTDPDSGVVTEYRYDPFGRRIAKIADASGTPQVTYFFHDGGRVCEERNGTGTTLATYVYGGYVDEVLTMTRGGSDYYFHTDDLYNVTAVTDATGAVVERYEYDDYGRPSVFDGAGNPLPGGTAIGNPLMFQGRPYDPETRLYWYRTRYYDPSTGRFTSRDSIGIWGDATNLGNGYTFVGNNPWSRTDPFGEGFQAWVMTGVWDNPASDAELNGAFRDGFAMNNWDRTLGTGDAVARNATLGYADSVGGEAFRPSVRANADTTATIIISTAELAAGSVGVYQGLAAIEAAGGLTAAGSAVVAGSGAAALAPGVAINAAALPALAGTAAASGAVFAGGHDLASMMKSGGLGCREKMAAVRGAGQAGEASAGTTGSKKGVTGPVSGKMRFPDKIDPVARLVKEVKNVARQGWTAQLKDYAAIAKAEGMRFELWVRQNTILSKPLKAARDAGDVIVKFFEGL